MDDDAVVLVPISPITLAAPGGRINLVSTA